MNERIRELSKQAAEFIEENSVNWVQEEFEQKFAELIVQDIINVLESTDKIKHGAGTTYDLSVVEGTIERSIDALTEHYGMKKHFRIRNERTLGRKVSSL